MHILSKDKGNKVMLNSRVLKYEAVICLTVKRDLHKIRSLCTLHVP